MVQSSVRRTVKVVCLLVLGAALTVPSIATAGGKQSAPKKSGACEYVVEELRDPQTGLQMSPPPDPVEPCNREQLMAEAKYRGQLKLYTDCVNAAIKRDHEVQGMSRDDAAKSAAEQCKPKKPADAANVPQCVIEIERARKHLVGLQEWCSNNPADCMSKNAAADNWANKCRASVLAKVLPAWRAECVKRVGADRLVEQKYVDGMVVVECGPRIASKFVYNFEEYMYSGTTNGDRNWARLASDEASLKREVIVRSPMMPAAAARERTPQAPPPASK